MTRKQIFLFDNFMPEYHIFPVQQCRRVGVNSQLTSLGLSCHNVFMLYKKQIPWDVTRLLHRQTVQDWAESISCEVPQARKRSQDFLIEKKGMNKHWIGLFFVFFFCFLSFVFEKKKLVALFFSVCFSSRVAVRFCWKPTVYIFPTHDTRVNWHWGMQVEWFGRKILFRQDSWAKWLGGYIFFRQPAVDYCWLRLVRYKIGLEERYLNFSWDAAERVDRNLSFKNVKSHLGGLAYDVW